MPYSLIFLNSLFSGGRLFVGAVNLLYFLSLGFQPADYAWVKLTQALVFIVGDIPLGYFIAYLGNRKSLVLALLMGMAGSLGFIYSETLEQMIASELACALSLSIWPVALTSYAMRRTHPECLDRFFHLGDGIDKAVTLLTGFVGGIAYVAHPTLPYWFFFITYGCALLVTALCIQGETDRAPSRTKLRFGRQHFRLIPLTLLLLLTQFLLQPFLHYWQPLFAIHFSSDASQISMVFICYSLTMSVTSWGFSSVAHYPRIRSTQALFFYLITAIVGIIGTASLTQIITQLPVFALTFALLNLCQVGIGVTIQKKLNPSERVLLSKSIAFIARFGMLGSLALLHFQLQISSVAEMFRSVGIWGLVGVVIMSGIFVTQKKEMENNDEPNS